MQRANSASTRDVTYKLKWRVMLDSLHVYDGVNNDVQEQMNRETLHADFIVLQRMSKYKGNWWSLKINFLIF